MSEDFEVFERGSISYGVGADGLVYKNGAGEIREISWDEIVHIKDCPGYRLELLVEEGPAIGIPYETPDFSRLMNRICIALSRSEKGLKNPQMFLASTLFYLCCLFAFVMGTFIILFEMFVGGSALAVSLSMVLTLLVLLPFHTVGVSLGQRQLKILKPFRGRTISYDTIAGTSFEIQKEQNTLSLMVHVRLLSGECVKIPHLKKCGQFMILLKKQTAS